MKNIIESNHYILTKKDETHIINTINNQLNDYEKLIKSDSAKFNQTKIINGSIISESILNLIILKKGFLLRNNIQFNEIIEFCQNEQIIPLQCGKFLNLINDYKNKTTPDFETSKKLTSTFLQAFMYYLTWFDNTYKNTLNTKNCCKIISLQTRNKNAKLFNLDGDIKFKKNIPKTHETNPKLKDKKENKFNLFKIRKKQEEVEKNYVKQKNIEKTLNSKQIIHMDKFKLDLILEQLDQQNKSLLEILKIVLETLDEVKDINEQIKNISININNIQSHTEKLLDNAWSEEELDKIIQIHTNQCVENILQYQSDISNDDAYTQEKIKLIDSFGENTWNKLSQNSKTFLITSKVMYNKLLIQNDVVDYSGICVLVTKALEVEIFKRFFTSFIEYLDENYHKDYSQYHTALLFQNIEPLYPKSFTMGNIAFVLCYKEDRDDSENQKLNNKLKLMEYCKSCIFSNYSEDEINELLNCYASSIEEIRVKYRNPSAHRNKIERINAKECFDLIIDVKKLLKKMLDSFDE